MTARAGHTESTSVLIIGTGFAGLGMAIRLAQRGERDFLVLEADAEIGGTWRDNHYPGAACDVMSHVYSYSFAPNPRWGHMYGRQAEILAYTRDCAERFGIVPHLRMQRRVVRATFDDATARWTVETADGSRYDARTVVSGTGGLSRPTLPTIEGIERFTGPAFHSARWDHSVSLRGKRVAIVGTGASAIQIVPEVAKEASAVTVYQRTPPWIVPRLDRPIGPAEQRLYAAVPALQRAYRLGIYWRSELRAVPFVVDRRLAAVGEAIARAHLRAQVPDPALRALLTPDYMVGCKRVLISNDYYPALQRPNVELVPRAVRGLVEDGVADADGQVRPADVVVFCSGFQASESVAPFEVRGLGGRDLGEAWRDGAEAYLGTSVTGFPGFHMLVGPNTGLGHSSMIFMIEAQIEHVLGCLDRVRREGLAYLDVRPEVQAEYNRTLHEKLARSVWASGCSSWYQTRDGKNTTLWPGFTFTFRMRAARHDASAYRAVRR